MHSAAGMIALTLELVAVLIVAIGSVQALDGVGRGIFRRAGASWKRPVWLQFAAWIVLSLEFALAADICRTAIAPTWDDIGRLGAIAAIRTVLNFFLNRDLEEFGASTAGEVKS